MIIFITLNKICFSRLSSHSFRHMFTFYVYTYYIRDNSHTFRAWFSSIWYTLSQVADLLDVYICNRYICIVTTWLECARSQISKSTVTLSLKNLHQQNTQKTICINVFRHRFFVLSLFLFDSRKTPRPNELLLHFGFEMNGTRRQKDHWSNDQAVEHRYPFKSVDETNKPTTTTTKTTHKNVCECRLYGMLVALLQIILDT